MVFKHGLSGHSFTHLQQQGRYEDDFQPTESSLQALEGEGDFMQGFFVTVSTYLYIKFNPWETEYMYVMAYMYM